MVIHTAMMRQIGKKSQKILLNLSKCLIIKYALTARRLLKEGQVAIRLYASANNNFVLFADKNGCPIIRIMETKVVTAIRK